MRITKVGPKNNHDMIGEIKDSETVAGLYGSSPFGTGYHSSLRVLFNLRAVLQQELHIITYNTTAVSVCCLLMIFRSWYADGSSSIWNYCCSN